MNNISPTNIMTPQTGVIPALRAQSPRAPRAASVTRAISAARMVSATSTAPQTPARPVADTRLSWHAPPPRQHLDDRAALGLWSYDCASDRKPLVAKDARSLVFLVPLKKSVSSPQTLAALCSTGWCQYRSVLTAGRRNKCCF